jgi:hypothetical protein
MESKSLALQSTFGFTRLEIEWKLHLLAQEGLLRL